MTDQQLTRRPDRHDRSRRSRAIALAFLSVVLIVGALVATLASDRPGRDGETPGLDAQAAGAGSHGSADGGTRTVVVGPADRTDLSSPGGPVMTRLVRGRAPATSAGAVVLSDEDCAPDAKGISRCLNELRLPNGAELTVRHNHRMSEVPCLEPGERVRVRSA